LKERKLFKNVYLVLELDDLIRGDNLEMDKRELVK